MQQQPTIIHRSPGATKGTDTVLLATNEDIQDFEIRSSIRGSPDPSFVSTLSQQARESSSGLPEHPSQEKAPLSALSSSVPSEMDNLKSQYLQLQQELTAERAKTSQLSATNQRLNDEALEWGKKCSQAENKLDEEVRHHGQTNRTLQLKQRDASHWHRLLQDANRAMNSAAKHQQIYHQLEDSEITARAKRLRVDIRNFALRFAETKEGVVQISPASYSLLEEYLQVPISILDQYLDSASSRSSIIRAFLWAFLYEEVFRKFRWAPGDVGQGMRSLCDLIEPSARKPSELKEEVERKRNMWRAHTVSLVLEKMDRSTEETHDSHRGFLSKKIEVLVSCLNPIVSCSPRELAGPLSRLLQESLALDQVLSQQVARWTWRLPSDIPCEFDEAIMDTSGHNSQKGITREVQLFLAPALMKQGTSSGDDFLINEVHVKMEVEISYRPQSQSSGSAL
ncbi:uncharacterized protein N7511_009183, partial [Penicillium nucicola]|uniref:uncharacterized protein n=1 Tax=Penicillium nucicola TaxID=1850975 RepID=UPI002545BB63